MVRRRGRPASNRDTPLELSEIVDQALDIVHAEGLDAVSMRRLAAELGVTTGGLYHHVPDKSALLQAMVDRVWNRTLLAMPPLAGAPIDTIVAICATVREVWLSYFDLASLAVAVAEPNEALYQVSTDVAGQLEAFGFPDVPLAYSAIQTFTMGSVEIAANRKAASALFGRDTKAARAKALRMMDRRGADGNARGVADARFEEGDALHFEASLRALIEGLLAKK